MGRRLISVVAILAGTGIAVYGIGLAAICITTIPPTDIYNQTTAHGAVIFAAFGAILIAAGLLMRRR